MAPFVFAGAWAVSVDQLGVDQFDPFTKPAAMYGGGMFFSLPRSRIEAFGDSVGVSYRFAARLPFLRRSAKYAVAHSSRANGSAVIVVGLRSESYESPGRGGART